jgi:hypothetical protein
MLPRADDNRTINVSRKKMHKKSTAREIIARNKKIFVKKPKFTSSSTRGLATLEEEKSIAKATEVDK